MTGRGLASALAIPLLSTAVGVGGSAVRLAVDPAPCLAAAYTSHVTLVVEHGDGQVVGLCIGFDGSSITGEQILAASGLEYATAGYGSLGDAVCQIDAEPAAYTECLPSGGSYWVVFTSRSGGPWQTGTSGVSTEDFASGDAEGFRYDPESGSDPPPASPAGICAAALAGGASPTPGTPSASPSRQPATPAPATVAATPAATATPSALVTPAAGSPPAATAAVTPQRGAPAPGANPGLLVGAALGGALAGLAVVQLMLRRRRM